MTCTPVLVKPPTEILIADPETEATVEVIEAYRLIADNNRVWLSVTAPPAEAEGFA